MTLRRVIPPSPSPKATLTITGLLEVFTGDLDCRCFLKNCCNTPACLW